MPTPPPNDALDYVFERPITFAHGHGSLFPGRIDCYRRGPFNAQRAAEKRAGDTRRLRAEFQNPSAAAPEQLLLNQELMPQVLPGLPADLALNVPPPAAPTAASLPAWPNTLPESPQGSCNCLQGTA